ncbi:ribonuclease H-like domain-containing protein [Tanacetum coccineum]|uniref:Ribonuclease H-like domain-containing protein n=1 Tax=Tanacetum coccineum TaxID=301880 RepID=A0ABQ4ZRU1_9ASTR
MGSGQRTGPVVSHGQPDQQAGSGPCQNGVGQSGLNNAGHETLLPNTFNAMKLQDPTSDGTLSRFKVRLVANGSTQLPGVGVDVDENHSDCLFMVLSRHLRLGLSALKLTCPVDTESKLGNDGDPVSDLTLYRSLAGSLQYLTFTRPNIYYAVQHVCLYMDDPREPRFLALKRILWYVHGDQIQRHSIVALPMLLLRLVG